MFVCETCHDDCCKMAFIEKMGGSYGRCEGCGKVTGCLDCHGYKHLPPRTREERAK